MMRWLTTRRDFASLFCALALMLAGCDNKPSTGLIVTANQDNFRTVVVASKLPVLVEFWSVSCEPCKQLEPHLEDLAKSHHELLVVKVNAEQNQLLAADLGVQLLPTLIIFQGGEAKRRQVGAPKPEELAELVSAYVTPK